MENTFDQGNLPLNSEVLAGERIHDARANQVNTATVNYSTLTCLECGKKFTQKSNLSRHASAKHSSRTHPCTRCGKKFTRSDKLSEHMAIHTKRSKEPKTYKSKVRILYFKHLIIFALFAYSYLKYTIFYRFYIHVLFVINLSSGVATLNDTYSSTANRQRTLRNRSVFPF